MSGRGDIMQMKENVEIEEMAEPVTDTTGPN